MSIECFVAMGDSFTAGTEPGARRWPDEIASSLPGCRHVNLARAGARSEEVAAEQLEPALALGPDLVSLICGANDVLRTTRPDLDAFAATFSSMLGTLRSELPGVHLVTATYPDVSRSLPLRPRSRERVTLGLRRLNEEIRAAASARTAVCLEFAGHPARRERENFAGDGFHPSPTGHRHAARAFALGLREQLGLKLDLQEATT